jgi:tRNA(fMet)-specific endonuclease VapC
MAMIVADTDVLIEFLRGREPFAERVAVEIRRGLSTTAVTAFELLAGAHTAKQKKSVEDLLDGLTVLVLDTPAAARGAQVRRELEKRGMGIGMADSLIAGVCLSCEAALLTGNVKHFSRVPELVLARNP